MSGALMLGTLGLVHAGLTAAALHLMRGAASSNVADFGGKFTQPLLQRSGEAGEVNLSSSSTLPQGALVRLLIGNAAPIGGKLPPVGYFRWPHNTVVADIRNYQITPGPRRFLRDHFFLISPERGRWEVPLVPRETLLIEILRSDTQEFYDLHLGAGHPADLTLNRVTLKSASLIDCLAVYTTPAFGLAAGMAMAAALFGLLNQFPGPGLDESVFTYLSVLGMASGLAGGTVSRESTATGKRAFLQTAVAALVTSAGIFSALS